MARRPPVRSGASRAGRLLCCALLAWVAACAEHETRPAPRAAPNYARPATAPAQPQEPVAEAEPLAKAPQSAEATPERRAAGGPGPGAIGSARPTRGARAAPKPAGGAIAAAVARHRPAVTRCYVTVARQDRALAARKLSLDVDFVVDPSGRVARVQVGGLGAAPLEQALGRCVVAVFKRMRLPRQPEERTVRQHYTFTAGPRP